MTYFPSLSAGGVHRAFVVARLLFLQVPPDTGCVEDKGFWCHGVEQATFPLRWVGAAKAGMSSELFSIDKNFVVWRLCGREM